MGNTPNPTNLPLELKLLLPLDGSSMAESTLPITKLLGSRFQLNILLLHAIETNAPTKIHGEDHLTSIQEAQHYLQKISEYLRSPSSVVDYHVHPNNVGDVAASIIEHATESQTDWIVLCTHGFGGIKQVIFGSIAQKVLNRGSWPVLLIPPLIAKRGGTAKMERILVLVDMFHPEKQALIQAAKIAKQFNAKLNLLSVVPTAETLSGERAIAHKYMPHAMQEFLDLSEQDGLTKMKETIQGPDLAEIEVTGKVMRGDELPEIEKHVAETDPDLIVMTSHGRHGISALVEGSFAPRLIKQTAKPILLVRAD